MSKFNYDQAKAAQDEIVASGLQMVREHQPQSIGEMFRLMQNSPVYNNCYIAELISELMRESDDPRDVPVVTEYLIKTEQKIGYTEVRSLLIKNIGSIYSLYHSGVYLRYRFLTKDINVLLPLDPSEKDKVLDQFVLLQKEVLAERMAITIKDVEGITQLLPFMAEELASLPTTDGQVKH